MPTYRQNTITFKELIGLVADKTGCYYQYEVEDVLNSLAEVLQEQVNAGKIVRLRGVGAFRKREAKERTFYSKITGKNHTRKAKDTLHIKADASMIGFLNVNADMNSDEELVDIVEGE